MKHQINGQLYCFCLPVCSPFFTCNRALLFKWSCRGRCKRNSHFKKMFKTLELPGGYVPWPPYQGFALDPLGALSGPQTPRLIILHPPFLIPGYGPGISKKKTDEEMQWKEVLRRQCYSGGCVILQ